MGELGPWNRLQTIIKGQMARRNASGAHMAPEGLVLREVAPGVSARQVQERTEPTLKVPSDLAEMQL